MASRTHLKDFDPNNLNYKLLDFLLEERILFKLVVECNAQERPIYKDLSRISSMLSWTVSSEGYDYWCTLSNKFEKQLKEQDRCQSL